MDHLEHGHHQAAHDDAQETVISLQQEQLQQETEDNSEFGDVFREHEGNRLDVKESNIEQAAEREGSEESDGGVVLPLVSTQLEGGQDDAEAGDGHQVQPEHWQVYLESSQVTLSGNILVTALLSVLVQSPGHGEEKEEGGDYQRGAPPPHTLLSQLLCVDV